MTTLRDYQNEAVEAVVEAWAAGMQRPALVLATGLGKTVIMSKLIADCVTSGDCRPVLLVHRDELVRQTVDKLLPYALEHGFTVGVIQAGRHEVEADVVVASVQTLTRRLTRGRRAVPASRFDTIITDECHHAAAESYLRIYDHFGGRDVGDRAGEAKMLGVTATLARGDGVSLGHVWDEVVFERSIVFGIENNYLVRPRVFQAIVPELDLGSVKSHHGDWSDADLGSKMKRAGHRIGESILQYGRREDGTLRRGITFAPTIECALEWTRDFNAMGIVSKLVIGDTQHDLRQAIYRATHEGIIDMIVSVMCLTEGFDLPAVELAVIGRPTKKLPLYIQMIGRVLRLSEHTGKQDAVLLDVCGLLGSKMPVCLADLALPDPCECSTDCGCTWRYLCMGHCQCPMDDTWTVVHENECKHECRKGGEPPVGADEQDIDDQEIVMVEVDPFGDAKASIAKSRHKWLETADGVPFLAGNKSSNPLTVFMWPEGDDLWTVGSFGFEGKPYRDSVPLPFPVAAQTALKLYGPKPRGLVGFASEGQLDYLRSLGAEIVPEMSKQDAADRLSVILASRRLSLV